jgi:hypothetical protein
MDEMALCSCMVSGKDLEGDSLGLHIVTISRTEAIKGKVAPLLN